ncbi:hypothetical protein SHKM778_02950 [Streptomyces sp. KM77-8]|uniref:Uncharacterized protein n=1 Tax=Streptomyces haneummycinicus TaxID=3074435 RepID=A0AAT9H984_9ACTN
MRRTNDPSTGQQIAVSAALLVIDLMLIGWSVYAVGMAGWADSYQSDGVAPSSVPEAMSQALWLLGAPRY